MTAKAKKAKAQPLAATFPRKAVQSPGGATPQETGRNFAALVTSPELAAYRVINGAEHKSGLGELIDVPTLMAELRDQAEAVNAGKLAQAEAMLINQATALQSLFARLAERGMGCDTAVPFECNLRMALRAQSQCRATLETLATIRNPPVLFAKQANVTTGPQQINNGLPAASRARESESPPSKLLEATDGERMDTGAPSAPGGVNQEMEAVAAVHGTANTRR